jgi:hypothetical protein
MRGEFLPKPAVLLLDVVEMFAQTCGVFLEGCRTETVDGSAGFRGDPVAQLRAEVVEGRANALLVFVVGFSRWERLRALVVHSGLPFAGRERM